MWSQRRVFFLFGMLVAVMAATGAAIGVICASLWIQQSIPVMQPTPCVCTACAACPACPICSTPTTCSEPPKAQPTAHVVSQDDVTTPADAASSTTSDSNRLQLAKQVRDAAKWLMVTFVDESVDSLSIAQLEELMAKLEATRQGMLTLETPDEHGHFSPLLRAGTLSLNELAESLKLTRKVRQTLERARIDTPTDLFSMPRQGHLELLGRARAAIAQRDVVISALTRRYEAYGAASLAAGAPLLRFDALKAETERMATVDRIAALYKEAGAPVPTSLAFENSEALAQYAKELNEKQERWLMLQKQLEDAGVTLSTGKSLGQLSGAEEEYEGRRVDLILRIQALHATIDVEAPADLASMTQEQLQAAYDAAAGVTKHGGESLE